MPLKTSTMAKITPIRSQPKQKKWLTQREVADYLGLSISAVSAKSRTENADPIPMRKLDGKIQYDFELLKQWEDRHTESNYEEGQRE